MGKINEIISPEVLKSIEDLNASFQKTDASYKKLVDDIVKGNVDLKNYKGSLDEVNKALDDASKILKEKEKINKQEEDSKRKLNQLNTEQAKRMAETKRKISEKNKEIQIEIVLNDKNAGTLEKLRASNKKLNIEREKLNLSTKKGQDRLKALNKELDANNKVIKDSSDEYTKQKINIGNYGSAFDSLPGPMGNASRAGRTFLVTLKKIAANPIILIITLLVGALIGLVKIFKSTDDGGTKMEAMMDKLKVAMDVLKRRVVILIEAFKALFSGKFRKAGELFKESVKGMGEEMKTAANSAYDLVFAMDELNDRQLAFISEQAEVINQVEKLQAISKDVTKSDQERIKALEESLILEEGLAAKKKKFAEEEFNNLSTRAALKTTLSAQELSDFIKLNSEEQTQVRTTSKAIAAAWNVIGDEGITELENAYAKMINADTEFFRKAKRSISQLSALQKTINTKRAKDAKKQAEGEAELEEAKNERIHNAAISEVGALKSAGILKVEEAEKVEKAISDNYAKEREKRVGEAEKQADAEADLDAQRKATQVQFAQDSINEVFNIRAGFLENERESLNQQKEYELSLAGDNATKREQIEKKFEKQQNALRLKQAKNDRNQALFNIAISTAVSAVELFSATIPPGILSAIAIGFGAIQAGVVLSKPLPKLAKGTGGRYDSPETFLAGEAGVEALESPGGKIIPVKEPTVFTNAAGYRVYSNPELERMTGGRMGYDDQMLRDEVRNGLARLGRKFDNIKTYKITPDGRMIGVEQNNYTKNYINRMTGN